MNMRDTLQKVDDALRDSVIQQFAPKNNRALIPTANATPRRSPEQVAAELRGVFDTATFAAETPMSHTVGAVDNITAPPNLGAEAAKLIDASAEAACSDLAHAIEMLSAMQKAINADAQKLAARIHEFTKISGAISRAFKEFTSDASNGGSHVKETPKG